MPRVRSDVLSQLHVSTAQIEEEWNKEERAMKMSIRRIVSAIGAACVLFGSLSAHGDVVSDWNTIMINTVATQNPFAQARFAAITQLAVFEAVNACRSHYRPYLGTISAPAGTSAEAAAVAAAHDVLKFYFPSAAVSLDAAEVNSLAQIPNGKAKDDGVAVGTAAAAAMIALRANDGSAAPPTFLPATMDPGVWQPTPPTFGPGILLHWRNLTPFGIVSSSQFRSEPPPSLSSSRYT